jgi:uncharacterized protein (TIGR02391 family)
MSKKLIMSFEANTIQHLGVKMYSTVPPALAELIANAYDACATEVKIKLYDVDDKHIIVQDNGSGMSFNQVNDYFLRIGRNRRIEKQESLCGRVPTGKKGLGKLALFGIGDTVSIITNDGKEGVKFIMDWGEINSWENGKPYTPKFEILSEGSVSKGTTITLYNLKRKTGFPIEEYAESIARMFNFNNDFVVSLSLNDGSPILIDNRLKYKNIIPEFKWDLSEIHNLTVSEYENKHKILGEIVTTAKPLKANLRGITLFANGRLVNAPEFFGPTESSHFYSYATGWLNVDFIDNWNEDIISTNRQSIDWENPLTANLREYLADCLKIIEKDWRRLRKEKKRTSVIRTNNIDVENWVNTLEGDVKDNVGSLLNVFEDTPEISEETQQSSIQLLHNLIPEYPNLHWRSIHPDLKSVSEKYYIAQDYYGAFIEALKRYIAEVKRKSGKSNIDERALMQAVFNKRILSVTKKFSKTDGSSFDTRTIDNIEAAQQMLSEGIVAGGRNPIQHEEVIELSTTGLFSERDCLDFLSLLSHLFRRLRDSETT